VRKRLQNIVAESGLTLPIVALYTGIVWLLAGMATHHWWIQFAVLGVSAYLFVEMNNSNALIRVRNRMVGSTFLVISSAPCFMFESLSGSLFMLCILISLLFLFQSYQEEENARPIFYGYLFIGLASLIWIDILYFVPLLWILNYSLLQSLSIRTWMASVIGLVTPYWFLTPWVLFQRAFEPLADHFSALTDFQFPIPILSLSIGQILPFILTLIIALTGIIHFLLKSYEDRIRIRMLYLFFAWTGLFATAFLLFQPQHYDYLMRILIICACPFVAHFFTLTHSKLSNSFFVVVIVLFLLTTVANLMAPYIPAIQESIQ